MSYDDQATCPACGEVVARGSTICPHCGTDLDGGAGTAADDGPVGGDDSVFGSEPGGRSGAPAESGGGRATGSGAAGAAGSAGSGQLYCTSCGEPVAEGASSCVHCGASLGAGVQTSGVVGGEPPGEDLHQDGIFEFSLKYPISGGWGPVGIGAGLSLLTSLLVLTVVGWIFPLLILRGYAVRVGRAAARGDNQPPSFDDWGALLVNGVVLFVAYVPFTVVAAVVIGGLFVAGVDLAGSGGAGLIGLGALLTLPVVYVSGAIVPTLIATGSVTATYADLRFVRVAFSMEYFVGAIVWLVLQFVVQTVVQIVVLVLVLTVIGIVVAIPLALAAGAYASYLTWALFGHVCWDDDGHAVLGRIDERESLDLEF